jgi:hypothetical protein
MKSMHLFKNYTILYKVYNFLSCKILPKLSNFMKVVKLCQTCYFG